jgi:hypothetical protein
METLDEVSDFDFELDAFTKFECPARLKLYLNLNVHFKPRRKPRLQILSAEVVQQL